MVLEATFIVKFNTRPHRKDENLIQALIFSDRVAIIDVSLDRSALYFCNEVLDDVSGRHFYSKIEQPA